MLHEIISYKVHAPNMNTANVKNFMLNTKGAEFPIYYLIY